MTAPAIVCNHADARAAATRLATVLGTELLFNVEAAVLDNGPEFVVVFDSQGVALQQTGRKAPGPVRVDFASGAVDHRRKFGGGKGQAIAKAVGLQARVFPHVLDATAGLGRDAFVLATLGCRVDMIERNPAVQALLADGLARAELSADAELQAIIQRMNLVSADATEYLQTPDSVDVVYLDPMFPERQKSAQVKKEMKAFHSLVGSDPDADQLLERALEVARFRVVVKRPRKAPDLDNRAPSYRLEGKSGRFDIYALKKLPEQLGSN